MNYWWVNQNQTFKQETQGGYMWSPKRNRDGSYSQFYENMKAVSPGDIVFSYCNGRIACLGVAESVSFDSPRPSDFEAAGGRWSLEGWRVDVAFHPLISTVIPAEHMDILGPLLPDKYSPIRKNGVGNQVYLAQISDGFAHALIELIGGEAARIVSEEPIEQQSRSQVAEDSESYEEADSDVERRIRDDLTLSDIQKTALIQARRGQGKFRRRVERIERQCRITGVDELSYCVASHIKPWRVSTNTERLDGGNGLMLTPTADRLFDGGFISFANDGTLLISPRASIEALRKMGIPVDIKFNAGSFTARQIHYLEYHREKRFKDHL